MSNYGCMAPERAGRYFNSLTSHTCRYTSYSQGSGTVWLSNLACTSSDLMLSMCSSSGFGNTYCSHSEDVAVTCTHSTPSGKAQYYYEDRGRERERERGRERGREGEKTEREREGLLNIS